MLLTMFSLKGQVTVDSIIFVIILFCELHTVDIVTQLNVHISEHDVRIAFGCQNVLHWDQKINLYSY